MATTKKFLSITFLIFFSVCILIAGVYFLSTQSSRLSTVEKAQDLLNQSQDQPQAITRQPEQEQQQASYIITNGQDIQNYEIVLATSTTVFSALQDLSQQEKFTVTYKVYPEMGVLVQGINGVVNGTDDKYWQYWVDGILGEVAANKKLLKAGDKVEWKFDIVPAF